MPRRPRLRQRALGASTGGQTTTRFAYDNGNVWADLDGSNNLLTRRFYLDTVDSVFARISSGGTAAWYLPDHLGSIRDITDNSTGSVLDHVDYDPFGNVTNETHSSNGDRYKFTGRESDSETGLQFNRARYYSPQVGRWTSRDLAGFAQGDSNLYLYVSNAPTSYTDPAGEQSASIVAVETTDKEIEGKKRCQDPFLLSYRGMVSGAAGLTLRRSTIIQVTAVYYAFAIILLQE